MANNPETFEGEYCESTINSVSCRVQSWYEESINPTEGSPLILTLVGPQGVGKTSLCTNAINRVVQKYPKLQVLWAEGRTVESLVSFLEQYNSHSCEVECCSSELSDHQVNLFVKSLHKAEQKAVLVILPGSENQASDFITRLVHTIEQPTQLKKLCVINLVVSERKRTGRDTEMGESAVKSAITAINDLNAAVQSHLGELIECTSVNPEMCCQLLKNGIITLTELHELMDPSISNQNRVIYLYTEIVPKLFGDERMELKFREALRAGGNITASTILQKIDRRICIELKNPEAADAAKLIRNINSSISSADIAKLCDLTDLNPLLLKVSASLITFESALFGNSAAKFIRQVQKLKNSDRGSSSLYNFETDNTQIFPFIKYACDYLASNYHLGSYAMKLLKLSPNLKTWLPVHEFQNLKFPGETTKRQMSTKLVSLKWLANLGFIHFSENEKSFRISNTVKDYVNDCILIEESPNFVLETILLNIRTTRSFTDSVIHPFGKITEAFSPSLVNILGNHAMAILRQPALRLEIAKSKGISIAVLLQTIQQKLHTEPTNLEKVLELDALLAENKYLKGKRLEALKDFRNTCASAHSKLNGTNLTFLRIAETFCFYLGIEGLENEAQLLFDRILFNKDGYGKLGIIDEEAMAARKAHQQHKFTRNTTD